MHILMYGWEYPPKYNGGLGIACHGLAESLHDQGHHVTFVLPKADPQSQEEHTELIDVSHIREEQITETKKVYDISYLEIGSKLMPYLSVADFRPEKQQVVTEREETTTTTRKTTETHQQEIKTLKQIELTGEYNKEILAQTAKYAIMSTAAIETGKYDVIHAHDWMSMKAALLAREILQVPLIVHIHSTEYDRNGAFVNPEVEKIEREGIESADHVICVSEKVRNHIMEHYEVAPGQITVIPNGIDPKEFPKHKASKKKSKNIGFIGRLVHQKGPDKFVDLARDLKSKHQNYQFYMAGDGYMRGELESKIESLNLYDHVKLHGFVERESLKEMLANTDLVIAPSVSEPFGLVALEAIAANVPVIIGENAGVLEYLDLISFEHWNIFDLSNKAEMLLQDEEKRKQYLQQCKKQLNKLTWKKSATATEKVYNKLLSHSNKKAVSA